MPLALRLPVLALFGRALRTDARSPAKYLVRAAALACLLLSLAAAQESARYSGAPGLIVFGFFVTLNLVGITLLGCSYFATAITEEREEQALGLLRMTSLDSAAILLGKTGGRLIFALLLLAAQLPIVFLALALGGLAPEQILAAGVALGCWLVFCACFGLLASVVCRRSSAACASATAALLWILIGTQFVAGILWGSYGSAGLSPPWLLVMLGGACSGMQVLSPFNRIAEIMRGGSGAAIFTVHAFISLAVAAAFAFLAWVLFRSGRRDEVPAGIAPRQTRRRILGRKRLGAGRDPIAWKDYHFVAGGRVVLTLRIFGFLALAGYYIYFHGISFSDGFLGERDIAYEFIGVAFVVWGLVVFWLESSILAGRMFRTEVRRQTWSSLMTLPHGLGRIVLSKLKGSLPALVPSLLLIVAGFVCLHLDNPRFFAQVLSDEEGVLALATICLYFFTHPILVAYCSLFARWGAIAIAVGFEVLVAFMVSMWGVLTHSRSEDAVLGTFFVVTASLATVSIVAMRRRLWSLAAA